VTTPRPLLLTVGGLTMDNTIAADGRVAVGCIGGNAAYSAIGARCWAQPVGLVSLDVASYPRRMLDALRGNDILLDGVAWSEVVLRHADWFIYDADGHRVDGLRAPPDEVAAAGFSLDRMAPDQVRGFIAWLRARPEPEEPSFSRFRDAHPLPPEQVPAAWLAARGVHLAPCRPVVLQGMLPLFNGAGLRVTLDPGWQLAKLSFEEIEPFLRQMDAFLPSEVELRALLPGLGLAPALEVMASACRGTATVKLGARGSLVWDRGAGEARAVPALRIAPVDPTGAGDAFCGGFLAGLVETGDPVRAAGFGTVSTALAVSHHGADGALPIDQAACRAALGNHALA
jgi:ribokinase